MKNDHAKAGVFVIAVALLGCPHAHAADDALYEAAKKEGQVVWYTSLIVNQAVRPLVDAFSKKYPGVEVKYARGDSGPNAIKVINEARAGRVEGDVFDGIATTAPLLKAGLVEKFTPSEVAKYPPALRDADGRWNALVVYFLTPGVNTQLVVADEIKTAQDLLNPKWQGKIAWSTEPSSGAPVRRAGLCRLRLADHGRRQGHDVSPRAGQAGHRQCRRHQPRHPRSGDPRAVRDCAEHF
jgi:hypothetical protein